MNIKGEAKKSRNRTLIRKNLQFWLNQADIQAITYSWAGHFDQVS